LKLLVDENISPEITSRLRALKHDVKSIRECCKGYADEKIVEMAVSEERLIVTYDLDFGELYRNFGASSLILRLRSKNPSIVLKHLAKFLAMIKEQKIDMNNKLTVITEGKVRLIG